ncbi:hypothetical protein BGZ99_005053 [Dissophora globulifera]|uniref:3'-5' exonuclease domain-containing protein n=1 Tax=Dissophora globulifera TaxID=979702 RepID=A0A9P6UYX4_9FUNG|nr:hypothetical protein BGZ99_005053 [Dissophora globulifera]
MTVRHAWNWSKIKSDPKNPFFSRKSSKTTPKTAVILMANADIPMLQIKPPVFIPATNEQVQHALNVFLFMSDFNIEPRPLAVNALACSSTGLIHYLQVSNEHLSLILPTYDLTNGGRNPELIPALLRTFLESPSYTKIGFGAYEDASRIMDQYGIACKNLLDVHWMAKILGVGSTNVRALHDVFGEIHDVYIPGRISSDGHVSNQEQEGQLIDPRRWDWESHGSVELSQELVRCIAQDAFATLRMFDNIQALRFRPGYKPLLINPQEKMIEARDFLLTSIPRGTLLPVRSLHHLLKGPFMSSDINSVDRDAQALALVKLLIDNQELNAEKADTGSFTFEHPSVLSRRVALPGTRSSEEILSNHHSRKTIMEAFNCRSDELRLMQDSNMSRKPDRIQDLECFLSAYEWLEFLPGAELDESQEPSGRQPQPAGGANPTGCGRKEATLLAMMMNFGTIAENAKRQPVETRQWVVDRIERLVQHGALLRIGGRQRFIRVNPALLRRLKRIENRQDEHQHHAEINKVLIAK